jgi:hypothetical protein
VTAAEVRELRRKPALVRKFTPASHPSLDLADFGFTLEAALAALIADGGDPGLEGIVTGFVGIGSAECPIGWLAAAKVAKAARALAGVGRDEFIEAVGTCAEGCDPDLAEHCYRRLRGLAEFVGAAARARRGIIKTIY